MVCRYCAQEVAQGSQFCAKCGVATYWNAPTTAPIPIDEPKTSRRAIASLVCGCLFFAFPVPIVAIVLGQKALSEISKSSGRLKGETIAILGMVLGYVGAVFIPLVIILAAFVIPGWLETTKVRNEPGAISALHHYNQAAKAYAELCPDRGYPASNANLGPGKGDCEHANLVDRELGSSNPEKSGYVFFYQARTKDAAGHVTSYTVNADPFQLDEKGVRHFFTDESGVIRYALDQPAEKSSLPVDSDDDQE